MLNNAEPYRRALCSCCVRRTMKDSPSDSWLYLAGSITLCLSSSLSLLLCCMEWQGDSRLGISQSLSSSSVPSACKQPRLLIPVRYGTLQKKGGGRGGGTTEETKQDWRRKRKNYKAWTPGGSRAEGNRSRALEEWRRGRDSGIDRDTKIRELWHLDELQTTWTI